jgi:hypothetical protein
VNQRNCDDWPRNSDIDDAAVHVAGSVLSGSPLHHAEDKFQATIACEHEYACSGHRPEHIRPFGTDGSSC